MARQTGHPVDPTVHPEGRAIRPRFPQGAAPLLYILPALVPLLFFTYWPLLRTAQLSLYDWNMVSPEWRFVGADNYTALLMSQDFWLACWNILLYVVGMLLFSAVLPLVLAVLLTHVAGAFLTTYKVILFCPAVISFAVAAITWLWIFNPIDGVLNRLLSEIGANGYRTGARPSWRTPGTGGGQRTGRPRSGQ
jgi:sn-glycerol 3-phosphate transport system permease protein